MKKFIDLGSECIEYLKVAKASEGKSCSFLLLYFLIFACLSLLPCLIVSFLFV
jgi:hypothetical protein